MFFLIISFIVIIIIFSFSIIFIIQNGKIKELLLKINLSYEKIKENLNKKGEIVDRLINIIQRELKKENKTFKKFKTIKSDKLSDYEIDKLLSEIRTLINTMKEDNTKLSKVKSFDGLISDMNEIDNSLVALRTFYNKYAGYYNNLLTKKSYIILKMLKKYKLKTFFEGKELLKDTTI